MIAICVFLLTHLRAPLLTVALGLCGVTLDACGVDKGKPSRAASARDSELSRYEFQGLQLFSKVAIKGQNVLEAAEELGLASGVRSV